MAKITKESFEHLGYDYQCRLIAQVLLDRNFANSIIDIIDQNFFSDPYHKKIVVYIRDAKKEYDLNLDFEGVELRILSESNNHMEREMLIKSFAKIKESNQSDAFYIQEQALNFCKHQALQKSIKDIQKIIDTGDVSRYEECEKILRKALEHGDNKDDSLDIFYDINTVLADDFRKPIRTGISTLDRYMDGGLAKGELGVILAAFGVGKTTIMTKMANAAYKDGKKVLQVFFEDNPKVVQRKHLSCISGIDLNKLVLHKEELIEKIEELEGLSKLNGGSLKLKKFPSDGTTIQDIKRYVRKLIAQGWRPDIIFLDYIDVVVPSTKVDDAVNVGEGKVMREFETLLSEYDIAGWTAIQGNRSAIGASVVEANQMGGSIKKGQIGHFILSIAKTLPQKENGTATMAILKSRFGKDGIVFENIIFNNGTIQIEMEPNAGITSGEHKKREHDDSLNTVRTGLGSNRLAQLSGIEKELLNNKTN